jgi:hypothetical protein
LADAGETKELKECRIEDELVDRHYMERPTGVKTGDRDFTAFLTTCGAGLALSDGPAEPASPARSPSSFRVLTVSSTLSCPP